MVRVINWNATRDKDGIYVANCHQFPNCVAQKADFDDLLDQITIISTDKMGSCKVLITHYIDIN